jgi:hypothetical protein
MAMSRLILAGPDAACGKVLPDNRHIAEQRCTTLELATEQPASPGKTPR